MKITRRLVALFIVILLFVGTGPAYASSTSYSKLPTEQKFIAMKNEIVDAAYSLSHYKANEAYTEILNSLAKFERLHQSIKEAKHPDDVIEDVAQGMDEIADSYERISNLSIKILRNKSGIFRRLIDISGETSRTKNGIEKKIKNLESENERNSRRLNSSRDTVNVRELEISIKGNDSIINSLRSQLVIWDKFYSAQDTLKEKLDLSSQNIELLLHVLDVNANVYKEAANTTKLRKTAKGALESLSSLGDIQSIISDLQDSWIAVDDLVNDISQVDFSIDL